MTEEVLLIGDVKVFDRPVVMKCYGLGTCVGLFIKDHLTGITGGAHIFLPEFVEMNSFGEGIPADECVERMLKEMKKKGASLDTLRAKIAGGSNSHLHFYDTGQRNTRGVIDALVRNKVYIAAMDVGGTISRTVKFNTASGELTVRQLEWDSTKVF
jgi:chemotaxis protein CheD